MYQYEKFIHAVLNSTLQLIFRKLFIEFWYNIKKGISTITSKSY